MMDSKDLVLAITGSGGIVGGLVAFAVFIYSRIDKKREDRSAGYHEYADAQKNMVDALYRMLESKDAEIKKLQAELDTNEDKGILTLPKMQKISSEMRTMREALSKLNVLILNDEQTNIFAERFGTVQKGISNIERILSE